ncbi:hypothetical protein TNCT_688261 [Trichonephila clavata]|uniref:Uncharacterized protein n=1 Tax=Trichonephila clavata TaxID=2740835 RepID=A0A8X6G3V0_TRICU|nr:hypothetical protein TNCT_688261 [Trichonephila clavata]
MNKASQIHCKRQLKPALEPSVTSSLPKCTYVKDLECVGDTKSPRLVNKTEKSVNAFVGKICQENFVTVLKYPNGRLVGK